MLTILPFECRGIKYTLGTKHGESYAVVCYIRNALRKNIKQQGEMLKKQRKTQKNISDLYVGLP